MARLYRVFEQVLCQQRLPSEARPYLTFVDGAGFYWACFHPGSHVKWTDQHTGQALDVASWLDNVGSFEFKEDEPVSWIRKLISRLSKKPGIKHYGV